VLGDQLVIKWLAASASPGQALAGRISAPRVLGPVHGQKSALLSIAA